MLVAEIGSRVAVSGLPRVAVGSVEWAHVVGQPPALLYTSKCVSSKVPDAFHSFPPSIVCTALDASLRACRIYRHVLGIPGSSPGPDTDELLYEEHDPAAFVDVTRTKDGVKK